MLTNLPKMDLTRDNVSLSINLDSVSNGVIISINAAGTYQRYVFNGAKDQVKKKVLSDLGLSLEILNDNTALNIYLEKVANGVILSEQSGATATRSVFEGTDIKEQLPEYLKNYVE